MSRTSFIFLVLLGIVIMLSLANDSAQFDGSISGKPWGNNYPRTSKEAQRELQVKSNWVPTHNKGYNYKRSNDRASFEVIGKFGDRIDIKYTSPRQSTNLEDMLSDPYIQDRLNDENNR